MKKTLVVSTLVAVLALGAVSFAQGGFGWPGNTMGSGGWGGSGMMGSGMMGSGMMGGHMQGSGMMGGHMQGSSPGNGNTAADREFLDETVDLRREFNQKMFDYEEALRRGEDEAAGNIARQLDELSRKINEKAQKARQGSDYPSGGYGWRQDRR